MNGGHSPELTVLLQACAVELSAGQLAHLTQRLTQHPLNWDRLYALASRHRLTPFLYRTLQNIPAVPDSLMAVLRSDCQLSATDNLLKLREYHQVAALLTKAGIAHIAYKGVHLAEYGYPDPSLRPCGDIDILVATDAAPQAIRLLQTHQYGLNKKHTLYWQHDAQSLLDDLYEVSLFKPFYASHFDIDLHWAIVCFNKHFHCFRLADFLDQPAFATELQVVLLITHHGATNIWQHIYYVNDLYFLLNDKSVDWGWLLAKIRLYGLENVFFVGLHWCRQVWALPLPPEVEPFVNTDRVRRLAATYEQNWESAESLEMSGLVLKQLTFFAKAQTRPGTLMRIYYTFFTSRVFRASTFKLGRRLIYIPKELGFITVFIRAIRSFGRLLPARWATTPARALRK